MVKFTAYRVTALPTSNIDEGGIYFLRSGSKVTIYVRYNSNWELVGGTGDVEKVNGLTGEVEIDLDFTSGQLKVISSGTGTPITTTSINLDTRYERLSNKVQDLTNPNATTYPSTQAVHDALLAGIPKEEKITGTRYTNTSASGVLTFDMDSYKVFDLVLTGNTDFQIQNPPTGTETKVIEGLVTGNHGFGLPLDWVPLPNNDDYIGSMVNHIVVTFIKSGYGGIFYSLQNIILNE